jgi:uncharacterized membrane protein YjfL (UPF0719 family)
MTIDDAVSGLVYLVAVFSLFVIGKAVFDKLNSRYVLREQLLERDNLAVALSIIGYYFGLTFAVGGIFLGPELPWVTELIDIYVYGLLSIALLNLSAIINDKIILRKFDNVKEIIEDQNPGTGIVECSNYIAVGLIINGAMSGEGGGIVTALAFWILGQGVLIIASFVYDFITPFDVHAEIEKDNVAVGVAFAGMTVAIGNIIRIGISGDFLTWQLNLGQFAGFVVFGLILLPVLRLFTDKLLLPGESLTKELVQQEKPNVGAGAIEAFSYIAASFLLGWVV